MASRRRIRTLMVLLIVVGTSTSSPSHSIPALTGLVHRFTPTNANPDLQWLAPEYSTIDNNIALPPVSSLGLKEKYLNVFLAGTSSAPQSYTMFLNASRNSGMHTLGLVYQYCPLSVGATAEWCTIEQPQNCACQGDVHEAVVNGGTHPLITVDPESSIVGRLSSALSYLSEKWPHEGWDAFIEPTTGVIECNNLESDTTPKWNKIIFSGHSQGAGHAVWLGKRAVKLARAVSISGPQDTNSGCSWVTHPRGSLTPSVVGFAHSRENSISEIESNWEAGLSLKTIRDVGSGTNADVWKGADALVTSVTPAVTNPLLRPEHGSTAADVFTPKHADGTSLYATSVWPWLLTAGFDKPLSKKMSLE
eukprot:m.63330 g.63330  ORF g.63330 m.63330 type:complete len:363 (+) comp23269_c0_seq1:210-1298(+)